MQPTASRKAGRAWPVLKEYAKAAAKYPWLLAGLLTGSLAIEMASVVSPLYIKQLIDAVAGGEPSEVITSALSSILAIYAGIQLARWAFGRLQAASLVFLETKVTSDLYERAYSYLIGHSHHFFTSNFAGSLQRRVSRYAQSFNSILESSIYNFITTGIFTIGAIFILSQRSIWLGLGIFVWAAVFIYLQFVITRYRQPLRTARVKAETRLTGTLSDSISNQSTVSQFAAFDHERSMVTGALDEWSDATKRTNVADVWIWGIQGLFAVGIEVALLCLAVVLWKDGLISVGDFVLIQVYVLGLIQRISNIGNSIRHLYSTVAEADEMLEIFDTPYSIQDAADARELDVQTGEIRLDHVSFGFNGERIVLEDFNLVIAGGEKVALVGPSGAGKSTVTKLLLRMYDVTRGSIRVDGQNIAEITQETLRGNISFVPQEPILFHRSLKDNIRYGRPDASDEEVIDAAKKAHCHEFISGLTEGYDTHVGERGVKLSGGERQRVAIARAILKNAPILILDEATSALDSESEALIQDALRILMEGKTVIVIAHRLSTIMTMDRIVVIEGGKIAAEGTHDELVNHTGGLYQKLWSIQAGGFLDDSKEKLS